MVADSHVEEEWRECLAKGAFVTAGEAPFDLIETMAFDPLKGMPLLERHLARIKARRAGVRLRLRSPRGAQRAPGRDLPAERALAHPAVARAVGGDRDRIAPMPEVPEGPVRVAIALLPVAPDDFRLAHKTSRRGFYDSARAESGAFEVVFTDAEGFLTEGSFTSIFVERGGRLVTPPLARGLLPGVLRAELLDSGRAIEGDLTPADLADGFFLGNALRGLVSAVTVAKRADATV